MNYLRGVFINAQVRVKTAVDCGSLEDVFCQWLKASELLTHLAKQLLSPQLFTSSKKEENNDSVGAVWVVTKRECVSQVGDTTQRVPGLLSYSNTSGGDPPSNDSTKMVCC